MRRTHLGALTSALFLLGTTVAQAQLPPKFDPNAPAPAAVVAPQAGQYDPNAGYNVPNYAVGQDFSAAPVDQLSLDRSKKQMNGDFGGLDRQMGLPLGMTQDAWSSPLRNMAPGQVAPGVVKFQWAPELVMQLRLRTNMITTIVLPPWEEAADVFIGEDQTFSAAKLKANTIGIKTEASGKDTSMTVLGKSGNLYIFYLRGEDHNTRVLTDMMAYVEAGMPGASGPWFKGASFNAPAQAVAPAAPVNGFAQGGFQAPVTPVQTMNNAPAPAAAPAPIAQTGPSIPESVCAQDRMVMNMDMFELNAGDRAIAPEYIYSDGVWTCLFYGKGAASVDRPVVYRVVDGVETRVNTRTVGSNGEVLVIEAVGDFVLRNGNKVVCLKKKKAGA